MAKFFGIIGFEESCETSSRVWTSKITERNYYGDFISTDLPVKGNKKKAEKLLAKAIEEWDDVEYKQKICSFPTILPNGLNTLS